MLRGESFELFSAATRIMHFAINNPSAAEKKIISLLSQERLKIERGEATAGTVNNWLKTIRLFLEMNDVPVNRKKIRRMLPAIRRYALDRVPTLDELREMHSETVCFLTFKVGK